MEGGTFSLLVGAHAAVKRAMSASSLLVLLWSTALLSEKGRLLAVVNAEASQLPDCTATADGGQCDRIDDEGGCPRVREVSGDAV